jgi:hypothetical protein
MRKFFHQAVLVSLLAAAFLNAKALRQETAERAKPKRHRFDARAPGAEIWPAINSSGQNAMNKTSAGANQNWVIILNENFESGFPQTNHWTLLWSSLAPYSWDDVNFNPHSSAHSAWCAGGRQSTQVPNLNPANDNYPNDLDAWMIWGPFNLQDATDAELQFWYWNDSEQDFDFFSVGGSIDNNEYFFPVEISGNSNGWQFMSFNLNSLSGQPQVWIAFNFLSDEIENAKGAFVDDIVLRKMTANTAPTITHQPVTAGKSGTELPITATISDNEAITAKLFYRPGGASTYKNITMTANANTFTGVIPATEVTSRGLEYYISATDGQSTTYNPPSNFETNPHRLRVTVANWTNPSPQPTGSAQNSYRLISIPSELGQARTDSIFFDDLGGYNDTKWRLFRFEGGSFFEFPDPKAAAFAPGKAFWLIVRDANKIIDAGSGLSTATADSFTITFEPGWNDIGLPFDFPVNWSQVGVDRAGVDGPYLYEGTWLLPSAVSQLAPWKGYAVKNLRTTPITLKIPPRAADATSAALVAFGKKSEGGWTLQIKAQCDAARDEMNFLGWSSAATPEKDAIDFSEPPPIGEFVALSFPHEEWRHYPGNYTNDFRPPAEDGEIWRVRIETNILAKPVQVRLHIYNTLGSRFELWSKVNRMRVFTR